MANTTFSNKRAPLSIVVNCDGNLFAGISTSMSSAEIPTGKVVKSSSPATASFSALSNKVKPQTDRR